MRETALYTKPIFPHTWNKHMPANISELKAALYLGKHSYFKRSFYFCKPIHIFLVSVTASSICPLPRKIRSMKSILCHVCGTWIFCRNLKFVTYFPIQKGHWQTLICQLICNDMTTNSTSQEWIHTEREKTDRILVLVSASKASWNSSSCCGVAQKSKESIKK